jgi:hypothetical protein
VNLSFPASFSLVHFFWRSKRNEQLNLGQAKESDNGFRRAKNEQRKIGKRTDPPIGGELSSAQPIIKEKEIILIIKYYVLNKKQ